MNATKTDSLIKPLDDQYIDYLHDESRMRGQADSISFPRSDSEIQQIVKRFVEKQIAITVQGSRTGITGGAVPTCGHVLNLSKMNNIVGLKQDRSGIFSIQVQPGTTLIELNNQLHHNRFDTSQWHKDSLIALDALKKADRHFWPVDPSENTASIGGITAHNSRGICGYHYGPARQHIKSIRLIDPKGDIHTLLKPDLIDIYIGSEGMLGVITEIELKLQPRPIEIWGVIFFFDSQFQSLKFCQALVKKQKSGPEGRIVAIDFMDQTALECIQQFKQENAQLKVIPDIDKGVDSAIYLEIHGNSIDSVEGLCQSIMETATAFGCDLDTTWAFSSDIDMERIRRFRHAAPESVNRLIDKVRLIDPRVSKVGTDMQLKTDALTDLVEMYLKDLEMTGLKAAIFGHAADGLFHVNILPQNYDDYINAKALTEKWADEISIKGGSVVTEHGIGKIKKHLFKSNPLPQHLKKMIGLKQKVDPKGLWNPGNMID